LSLKLIFLSSFFWGHLSESCLPAKKDRDWFDYSDCTDCTKLDYLIDKNSKIIDLNYSWLYKELMKKVAPSGA